MLQNKISGLPVVNGEGLLVGMVTEGDFLRRAETWTERKRSRWLEFLMARSRRRVRPHSWPQGFRDHDVRCGDDC